MHPILEELINVVFPSNDKHNGKVGPKAINRWTALWGHNILTYEVR